MNAMNKRQYMDAQRAPSQTAAPATAGGGWAYDGVVSAGAASEEAYESGQNTQVVRGVRQVGNQALYRRGNQWVTPETADIDLSNAANVQTIERYSQEYFELVRANRREENQVLSTQGQDEELLIKLRGQVYQIR